jgi:hypothetical protein
MRKLIYLLIVLIIIYVSNSITSNLTKKKLNYELSKSFSDCYLSNKTKEDIDISKVFSKSGIIFTVSNNSNCLTIERMSLSIVSKKGKKKDTIDIVINNQIKPNYDANINLEDIQLDSILSVSYKLEKVNF